MNLEVRHTACGLAGKATGVIIVGRFVLAVEQVEHADLQLPAAGEGVGDVEVEFAIALVRRVLVAVAQSVRAQTAPLQAA